MTKYLSIIAIVLFMVSCKKMHKLTQFNMEYVEVVTIQSSTGINLPFNIYTPDVQSNSETKFDNNNTKKKYIEHIELTDLDLTIQSPAGGDFSFLKSIEIYLSAPGLSEIKVAWNDNVPATTGNTLILQTINNDLQEYLKQDTFKLRVNTVTDEILTSDYDINVHCNFHVDARVLWF